MTRWLSVSAVALSACVGPTLMPEGVMAVDAGPFVCSPRTCTGCCLDNVCLGGNQSDACGYDGRRCQRCAADTRCEAPGACFALPGDGGGPSKPLPPDAGLPAQWNLIHRCQFFLGTWIC